MLYLHEEGLLPLPSRCCGEGRWQPTSNEEKQVAGQHIYGRETFNLKNWKVSRTFFYVGCIYLFAKVCYLASCVKMILTLWRIRRAARVIVNWIIYWKYPLCLEMDTTIHCPHWYQPHWKNFDPARTRTWNSLIRSQMPYPLGHRAIKSL